MEECQVPGEECFTRSLTFENDVKALKSLNLSRNNAGKGISLPLGMSPLLIPYMLRSLTKLIKWSNCTTRYHSISSKTGKTRDRPHPRVQCIKMRELREGNIIAMPSFPKPWGSCTPWTPKSFLSGGVTSLHNQKSGQFLPSKPLLMLPKQVALGQTDHNLFA